MLEIVSRRLQACLCAFVHILSCIKKHLFWDGCWNLLNWLQQLQLDLTPSWVFHGAHFMSFFIFGNFCSSNQLLSWLEDLLLKFLRLHPMAFLTFLKVKSPFCHIELKLLSICVCSIVSLNKKRSYYLKNADSGQSRATFVFFLACLGAEICRNSRLQFAC